ncbi:sensor domain-containing diguanylate cyclase [Kineosporia sp. R_H_3]|uniref:sensor domain-containing diguanylate cyclase n=1 Tax=Kineosporia sp. R_H_3 TaxID=1961848 RepID=UPI001303FE6E|nr:sensor domain-containing diguanylate cyclase [Kineosporia sp. R_H_3]
MTDRWTWPPDSAGAVWDAVPTILVLVSRTGAIRSVNNAFVQTCVMGVDEVVGKPVWEVLPVEVGVAALALWETAIIGSVNVPEQVLTDQNGAVRRISWSLTRVVLGRMEPHLLVTGVDLTAERSAQARLLDRVERDPLTGMGNRLYVRRVLTEWLDAVHGSEVAIFYCDLERFKAVNDQHGHRAGDVVLRSAATRLAEALGPEGVVARLGGDEFVALVRARDSADLRRLTHELRNRVAIPIDIGPSTVKVGLSVGLHVAQRGADTDQALQCADEAMYRSKRPWRFRRRR